MNERIKQLALQAGYEKDMFGIGHWDMPECQKFVELIVRECAAQFPGTFTDEQYQRRIDKTILKHFGVIE
jgi:CTP:phosphocholine cytidylyltransferase-like protein